MFKLGSKKSNCVKELIVQHGESNTRINVDSNVLHISNNPFSMCQHSTLFDRGSRPSQYFFTMVNVSFMKISEHG